MLCASVYFCMLCVFTASAHPIPHTCNVQLKRIASLKKDCVTRGLASGGIDSIDKYADPNLHHVLTHPDIPTHASIHTHIRICTHIQPQTYTHTPSTCFTHSLSHVPHSSSPVTDYWTGTNS